MSEFLSDPSVLTKDKLKSALMANNVALPNGEQKKGVYVELYLKNLTSQNARRAAAALDTFSSDDEPPPSSARKATRKTDKVRPEEIDVTELTNEGLKDQLLKYGVNAGPVVVIAARFPDSKKTQPRVDRIFNASTRKVYEKKLQKLLDQGPPELIVAPSESAHTDSSQNGNTDSDQYSDKEEEITAIPEPEPVPVVERPIRSKGKTPVTSRTRSSQHKYGIQMEGGEQEDDFQVLNIQRKMRRSSRRLDQTVPASDDTDVSEYSAAEILPAAQERNRAGPLGVPEDPEPRLADKPSALTSLTEISLPKSPSCGAASACQASLCDMQEAIPTDKFYDKVRLPAKNESPQRMSSTWKQGRKLSESGTASSDTTFEEPRSFFLSTAELEVCPDTDEILSSGPLMSGPVTKSVLSAKHTRQSVQPQTVTAPPSRDLIVMMCCNSPSPNNEGRSPLPSPSLMDTSHHRTPQDPLPVQKSFSKDYSGSFMAQPKGKQSKISTFLSPVTPVRRPDSDPGHQEPVVLIEKLSAVEQTPKTTERDVLKEMFPNEMLNTPTGISATRRRPIKGAASRPLSDAWLDDLRPRLTELQKTTSSSYTETRAIPQVSALPLSTSKPATPPSVQVKSQRRLPVWGQLLLVVAVAGFLFFIYQAMESNEMSPFGQPSSSSALDSTGK